MVSFLLKRFLAMVPVLAGIIVASFMLFNVVGMDPAMVKAGKAQDPEVIASIRKELGMDGSLVQQFFSYVKQVFTFDYGESFFYNQDVLGLLSERIGPTLSLMLPAFFLSVLLSVTLALFLVQYRSKWKGALDKGVLTVCLAAISISSLVYIVVGQYVFAFKWNLYPVWGWDTDLLRRWEYIGLPMLIFVALTLGGNILFYRTIFLDEVGQDYVRTARAKGLDTSTVYLRHILSNAMIPIITLVVMEMPTLILGALLLEAFFGIPGIGSMTYTAIQNADFPIIKAITILGAMLYMFFQLLSDVLYAIFDPRIRLR